MVRMSASNVVIATRAAKKWPLRSEAKSINGGRLCRRKRMVVLAGAGDRTSPWNGVRVWTSVLVVSFRGSDRKCERESSSHPARGASSSWR
jgi:hypothetical protein